MQVKYTNAKIYQTAKDVQAAFSEEKTYFPVKFNYYFIKNIKKLESLIEEIEAARTDIISHYALVQGDKYQFKSQEDLDKANKEINELFALEQELEIAKVDLSVIEEINLNMEQMEAIMFMIKE